MDDQGHAVDVAAVREALGRTVDEVCRSIETTGDAGRRVPDSDWTVGDVALHLALGVEAYVGYVQGRTEPFVDVSDIAGGSLAQTSAARLAAEPDRHLESLATRLREAAAALLHVTDGADADDPVVWNGQPLRLGDMLGIGLGEVVLHGRDIATASSRKVTIRPDDARLVLAAALPLLPLLADPVTTAGVRARYDLRVRGGVRRVLAIDDGRLTITVDDASVDCHVSAEPVALLLIAYGRRRQWIPILTGKVAAWGRKPWLGPRLVRYLVTP